MIGDWSKTVAWAWGGYYSRVFLNVKGREPNGVIRLSEYDRVRDEVAEAIESIRGRTERDGIPKSTIPRISIPLLRETSRI